MTRSRTVRVVVGLAAGAVSGFFTWATLIFALYLVGGNVILGRECNVEETWERRCNGIGTFADRNEPLVLGIFAAAAIAGAVLTWIVVLREADHAS